MQIVIKINEKDYQSLKDGHIPFNVLDVIRNGIILPKGHGRLVDESQITQVYMQTTEEEYINEVRIPPIIYIVSTNAPTVVEADKSERKVQDADSY